jgi:hypothetical protein
MPTIARADKFSDRVTRTDGAMPVEGSQKRYYFGFERNVRWPNGFDTVAAFLA